MTAEELLERRSAIAVEVEEDGADLDALEAEVKSINEELEARKEAEAQKAEIRAEVANGAGEIRESIPTEEVKKMTLEEIRSSHEYNVAFANYIKTGLKTWRRYTHEKYIINIDGTEWENEAALITVGNSSQWGNNARITPKADIQDGILDMTVVDMFSGIEMPALGLLLLTGKLERNSKVHCYRGKHITIRRAFDGPAHADGDWFKAGSTLDISIHPHSLNVIVP